jgi:hypothetical protein
MVTGRDEEVKELVLNDPRLGGRNLRIRESGSGIQKADLSLEVEVHGSLHHMVRELSREDARTLRDWLDEWLSTPPDPDAEILSRIQNAIKDSNARGDDLPIHHARVALNVIRMYSDKMSGV